MAERKRSSKHRRYSERVGGDVTVHVSPLIGSSDCEGDAVKVRITFGGRTIWAPGVPLCLSPLYDADSSRGRSEAADAAVDFFEAGA